MASNEPPFEKVKYYLKIMKLIDNDSITKEDLTDDTFTGKFAEKILDFKKTLDAKGKDRLNELEHLRITFYNNYRWFLRTLKPDPLVYKQFVIFNKKDINNIYSFELNEVRKLFLDENKQAQTELLSPEEREKKRKLEEVEKLKQHEDILKLRTINRIDSTGKSYIIDRQKLDQVNRDKQFTPAEIIQKLKDNVDKSYNTDIDTYITALRSELDLKKYKTLADFNALVGEFCKQSEFNNILIIDYENYKHSQSETVLEEYIEANKITHVVIVHKSIYSPIQSLTKKKIKTLVIHSRGLTLHQKREQTIDWRQEPDASVSGAREPVQKHTGSSHRFGSSHSFGLNKTETAHLINGHDDLLLLCVYERCKQSGKHPIIYSQDNNIKLDILSVSTLGIYNYKNILPFFCNIDGNIFFMNPSEINLAGLDSKFDDYYHQYNPTVGSNQYLQKYLKYKNKYLQLKKLI